MPSGVVGLSTRRPIAEQVTAIPIPTREELQAEIAEAQATHPHYFLNTEET